MGTTRVVTTVPALRCRVPVRSLEAAVRLLRMARCSAPSGVCDCVSRMESRAAQSRALRLKFVAPRTEKSETAPLQLYYPRQEKRDRPPLLAPLYCTTLYDGTPSCE